MSKNTNPYDVEMADLAKEIGGNLSIEYHTIKLSITCEQLQTIKENVFPTDVMSASSEIRSDVRSRGDRA